MDWNEPARVSSASGQASAVWRMRKLYRQRGLWGVKLGPANRGRRLDATERQAIEQKMRDEGQI